ncbi:MAG: hypothetical protein IJV35_05060 [Neisseriaceae bacterium]|nr:hypothetical protein [Neisseriaceae bacterium]
MTNEQYLQQVSKYINEIEICIKQTITVAKNVIGKNIILPDLYFYGLLDRNMHLARGFISVLKERNLTCVGALLRLQLDNCMRLYAIHIAENQQEVINYVLEGKSIRNLKDKNGKKMVDAYLKKQLNQYDNQFSKIYDETSGFIHFSGKAVYQSIIDMEDNKISVQIGRELPEKFNTTLIECSAAYLNYYRLFLSFMESAADWKKNFDENYNGNN